MTPEAKKKQGEARSPAPPGPSAQKNPPFDTRELDDLPLPNDQDPPYRSWWVVDYADLQMAISKRRHAV